jgi:hypothetical protein
MKKRFEVGKVGWENENFMIPIILLDKKTRAQLKINERDVVRVKNGVNKSLAVVQIQFWELVGTGKCTINNKLQNLLDVNKGEKVTVDTDVPDEEKAELMPRLPNGIVVAMG